MRLWSLSPHYLDSPGLVALWREALLAQAVLYGNTKGYRHHPQLVRFRESANPRASLYHYLVCVWKEGKTRRFKFDIEKIIKQESDLEDCMIPVTTGQLLYEWKHKISKLNRRNKAIAARNIASLHRSEHHFPVTNPIFLITNGTIECWEVLPGGE